MTSIQVWAAVLWAAVVDKSRALVARVRQVFSKVRTEGHPSSRTFTLPKKPCPWLKKALHAAAGILVSVVVGAAIGGLVVINVRPVKERVVALEDRVALNVKISESQAELIEAHRAIIMAMAERAAETEIRLAAMAAALARLEAPKGGSVTKAVALAPKSAVKVTVKAPVKAN